MFLLNSCKEETRYNYDIVETLVINKDVVYDNDRTKHFSGYPFEYYRTVNDTIFGVSENSFDKNGEYKFKKKSLSTESRSSTLYYVIST